MNSPIETINYPGGFVGKIFQDTNVEDPRADYDHAAKMVCFHRRYRLGDEHSLSLEEARDMASARGNLSLTLYLYDHSGLTISTEPFSCPWDSGQIGWIVLEKDTILQEWGRNALQSSKKRKQMMTLLLSEVKEYDQYLRGEVYGYVLEDDEGNELSSCWGFYGMESVEEELKEQAEYFLQDTQRIIGQNI